VKKIARYCRRAVVATAIAAVTAGCSFAAGLDSPAAKLQAGQPVLVTEDAAPSALISVVCGAAPSRDLPWVVSATARPLEDLEILQAGSQPRELLESTSPAAARVTAAGKPSVPGASATTYLQAQYRAELKRWHAKISAAKQQVATRTRTATLTWAHGLPIVARLGVTSSAGRHGNCAADPASLADESRLAVGALTGMGQQAGDRFGGRRVLLLYVPNLGGIPRVAELAGDDVIVVTAYPPSAARASTGQAKLLGAGAARVTVLGLGASAAQLAQLVTAGLSQKVVTETLSGSVLFDSGGTTLRPGAARVLRPLLAPLRSPGAIGVINGYAYALGNAERDYVFSLARALSVARFLEGHGIPASSLIVVGHGASHLVESGYSHANSQVLVAIEEP
jgi:outer membrane protein OmpA-like peptidoglycan-associated protein